VARLQAAVLEREEPPRITSHEIDAPAMRRRYGLLADDCLAAMRAKAPDAERADALNARLEERWPEVRRRLVDVALAPARLEQALGGAGAATRPEQLGIDPAFYREAVLHAREIRERYAMLDLAADAGLLEAFVQRC
jgi:glycerol-1-phosphate dehydrogenase [NAD(P)+]